MTGAALPAILLMAQALDLTTPEATVTPVPAPTTAIDWATLPDLPFRDAPQLTPAMHEYVKAHSRINRCRLRRTVDGRPAMRIEVAVLVHPEDGVRTAIPRAVGCPRVEQYAAGLVTGFARNNLTARTTTAEQWYRATFTFIWTR